MLIRYLLTGLLWLTCMDITESFMTLKMSSASNKYLQSLTPGFSKFKHNLNDVKICEKPDAEIDTILFNIYKVENVFFNRDSRIITFKLRNDMKNVYYYENEDASKLSNNTKIFSNAFKNFIFIPMNETTDVDAIIFKDA